MSHTAPGLGSGGEIQRRFDLPRGNEFQISKIAIEDTDGRIRSENEDDYRARALTATQSEASESTSSVIHVPDLGLGATLPPLSELSGLQSLEDTMNASQLRNFLGLKTRPLASVTESIREEIKLRLESASGYDNEPYLPIDQFNRIFGKESIRSLIREGNLRGENASADMAIASCISRRRILAILVYMKKLDYFENFVSERITDNDLPLRPARSRHEPSTITRTSLKENTTLFEDWEDNDVVLFYNHQSLFFVPFFDVQDNRLCSYTLDQQTRLPWRRHELKSSGGNGVVHQVEIHPSHHNFKSAQSSNEPLYFALKEIDTHNEDTYHQELLALEKTCAQIQKERHLIKLLLTFKHGQKYYFLFEWADGNLDEYWRSHRAGPERTIEKSKWAATQCLGLATALKRIHGLATWQKQRRNQSQTLDVPGGEGEKEYGRHGDIKPNNILWFASDGDRLVLSDLGLTSFHSSATRSLVRHTGIGGYTWPYRAPEIDNPFQNICSKYDIWSLGCVFLEFCSWWLLGIDGVEEFVGVRIEPSELAALVEEDNYFTVIKSTQGFEAIVKPSVTGWIERLRGMATGDSFAIGMLRLIQEDMLVVDKAKRAPSDVICTDIRGIIAKLSQMDNMNVLRMSPEQEGTRHMSTPRDNIDMETKLLTADNLLHMHITGGDTAPTETERKRALTLTSNSSNGDNIDQASDRLRSINTKSLENPLASFQGSSLHPPGTTEQPTQATTGGLDNSNSYAYSKVVITQVTNLSMAAENPQRKSGVTTPHPQESESLETLLSSWKAAVKKKFTRKGEKSASSDMPRERRTRSWPFKRYAE
ncbi:hypothetical protein GGR58DRAFT_463672 [Xylaria digitata]|nr:hypothetical protein GGR58DRAFT_463672 [Xylaria digitata]